MRKTAFTLSVLGAVVMLLVGNFTFAQVGTVFKVDIPYSFMLKDKEMPAGKYEFRVDTSERAILTVKNVDGGGISMLPAATRLADLGLKDPNVIFDVENGMYYLSEIHMPNMDGFAFPGAPGKHTHAKVKPM